MTAWFDSDLDGITFDELLARLASKDEVAGLLQIGSASSGSFSAASDYDLILVLRDDSPRLDTIATWIDGHLTEINCKTIGQMEELARTPGLRDITEAGALVNMIRAARVVFDSEGRLTHLQQTLRELPPPKLPGTDDAHDWWFRVGYELAHARRYLSSDDIAYRLTVEVRLLFSMHHVFMAYFAVRGIPWRGDKEAVKHLQAQDAAFLDAFLSFTREADVALKMKLYEDLAVKALAPVGEPWPKGATMVEFGGIFDNETRNRPSVAEAKAFWQRLIEAS